MRLLLLVWVQAGIYAGGFLKIFKIRLDYLPLCKPF